MLNEGRVLADRYEITGKIGTGGMSDVYKAKDHKLNRFVAIKVLKSEFSENRNFVSKFRIEAQSAAILTHPNIVNVYDVGDEDGLYYIVMELVEGITLKKYIEKKLRLSVKETVSIAIQVSMGIESAHNNHIIHRDIKPQNIIISKDGKVKVTDFGIARAATSNTITSNAMGSVHYTSPEQARGGYSDEKSDIYSLGVTMYEMLTGRVPFDGETTVSIAIKHIQEEMPSPREYVDDIPVSVEQIVLKCCQKNAARRYQTMGELIVDLKKSLLTPDEDFVKMPDLDTQGKTQMVTEGEIDEIRRQTGRIPYVDTGELYPKSGRPVKNRRKVHSYDEEPEYESESAGYGAIEEDSSYNSYDEEYSGNGYEDEYDDYDYENQDEEYYEQDDYDDYEDDYPEKAVRVRSSGRNKRPEAKRRNPKQNRKKRKPQPSDKRPKPQPKKPDSRRKGRAEEDEEELDPGMEKLMSVLGVIAAVIIALIAIFIASKMLGVFKTPEKGTSDLLESSLNDDVVMPVVTGMSFEDARAQLKSMGLEVKAGYDSSATVEKGQVMAQSIEEGESIPVGSEVVLTVSSGRDGVAIPDVIGISEAEARVALESEGFVMVKDESASDTIPKGNVISQNPAAGESVEKGATVTVIISTGESASDVTVPDIRLQTEADAKKLLTDAGLNWANIQEENSDTVPAGCVISQSYSPNMTVAEGTSVSFTISTGPSDKPQYYKCNFSVNAPAAYAGGVATVTLTQTDTGNVLFQTSTTSFPVAINLTNIQGSANASITIKYSIDNTVIHENEDGSIDSYTSSDEKKETQQVTLTPQ